MCSQHYKQPSHGINVCHYFEQCFKC
uniref:Uncharacterized protein n=1 Tax=Anguilla anguilla TaxID=7936 RepID=A0A0E9UY55_ANGAN